MAVLKYEIKKLLSSISLWGLLLIFFVFNLFLIGSSNWNPYPGFVSEAAETTGSVLGYYFTEQLDQLSVPSKERDMLRSLKGDTTDVVDHFDDYDITQVGEAYISVIETSDAVAEKTRKKYLAMQDVVNQKGEADEALSLGHASATIQMHETLFDTIIGWLMIEGIILSVLIGLFSAGFEKGNNTEGMVFTTKTGRQVLIRKIAASLIVGLGAYLLLTLVTLLAYFIVHDYSPLWQSYVSNVFNYRNDLIAGYRPFVTWQSYTILTYLFSKIGITLGLLVSFILSAFIVEMVIRNSYISFFVILILNGLFIVLPMALSNSMLGFYAILSPVWLWLKHTIWFTDGDVDILWKNFEVIGTTLSMLVLIMTTSLVFYRFRRRDFL